MIWASPCSEYVFGESPLNHNHPAADANHDFLVNEADYARWAAYFGSPGSLGAGAGSSHPRASEVVPEPAAWFLAGISAACVACWRKTRSKQPPISA